MERFDNRRLYLAACLAWLVPLGWVGAFFGARIQGRSAQVEDWLVDHLAIPIWVLLAVTALYFFQLILTRFQVSLLQFCLGLLVFGNGLGLSWAWAGWEVGVTAGLASLAAFGFALTWGETVALYLGWPQAGRRGALLALGLLLVFSLPGLLAAGYSLYLGWQLKLGGWIAVGVLLVAFCLLVQLASLVLARRARRVAWAVLGRVASAPTALRSAEAGS